jgi:preprotein translocase subunit YajC
MDFFERLFGIAPDGGDGTLEFLLFAIPIAGIAYLAYRRRQRRQREE